MDAEIGIVGAGPAGTRAAELLVDQGARVLLWDPRAPWEKPCGGGLPASALRNVPELREMIPRARRIDALRAEVSPETGFTVPLERAMYMASRRDLARWQLDRVKERGGDVIPASIRSVERDGDGWRVESAEDREWTVRMLVGADGAASLVRRCASPEFRVQLAPTRVFYPAGAGEMPGTVVVKFYEEVEGYLWDFPRVDHRSLGVGLFSSSGWNRSRMDRELEGYRRSGEGPGPVGHEEYAGRTGAVIGTAGLGHGDYGGIGDRSFALLGDAAGLADPATGEGIENALRSAELLAETYRSDGHFGSYPSRVRSLLEPEFRVARVVRNVLFDHGVGAFLIRKGMTRDWAYALVSAIADAVNEHDPSVVRLLRRGVGAYQRVRDEPDGAARGSRFGALAPGA